MNPSEQFGGESRYTREFELFSLCDMLSAAGLAVPGLDPAFEMGEIDFPD